MIDQLDSIYILTEQSPSQIESINFKISWREGETSPDPTVIYLAFLLLLLYLNLIYGHTHVFIKVVESVLTADKFQLPSPAATTTKEIAVAVIQWSKGETHTEQLTAFV